MNTIKRAILLHVVAFNVAVRHRVYATDNDLALDCRLDWARRVWVSIELAR